MSTITGHNGGNSRRAQTRVRSAFARWWAPWEKCRARSHVVDIGTAAPLWSLMFGARCRLQRGHVGRHAVEDGQFSIRYFDDATESTS